jgi:hypothetical protein
MPVYVEPVVLFECSQIFAAEPCILFYDLEVDLVGVVVMKNCHHETEDHVRVCCERQSDVVTCSW